MKTLDLRQQFRSLSLCSSLSCFTSVNPRKPHQLPATTVRKRRGKNSLQTFSLIPGQHFFTIEEVSTDTLLLPPPPPSTSSYASYSSSPEKVGLPPSLSLSAEDLTELRAETVVTVVSRIVAERRRERRPPPLLPPTTTSPQPVFGPPWMSNCWH